MRVNTPNVIQNVSQHFLSMQNFGTKSTKKLNEDAKEGSKPPSPLDKFETEVKNSADMNDTIRIPRTIFKGYLAFTASTSFLTVAMLAAKKHPKLSAAFNILSAASIIYGTFSFVRPYLFNPEQVQ